MFDVLMEKDETCVIITVQNYERLQKLKRRLKHLNDCVILKKKFFYSYQ